MSCNSNPTRANSVFWARALNIPLPQSFVFPQIEGTEYGSSSIEKSTNLSTNNSLGEFVKGMDEKSESSFSEADSSWTSH